jgi:ubiquinone/menaquinone biosynthesis C-methylase UbiE
MDRARRVYDAKKIAWTYRIFEAITRRYHLNSKLSYYLCWALVSLPFVVIDKMLRSQYAQSQSRAGYNLHGSSTDLQWFEKDEKIALVMKALVNGSLATGVGYQFFRGEFIQQMIAFLRKAKFETILEVGSGASINLYYLSRRFSKVECIGLDFAQNRIREAKTYWDNKGIRLSYIHASTLHLPLRERSMDVVFSSQCLEQIAQDNECGQAMDEMYRVSRRQVILLEPSYELGNLAQKFYIELRGYSKHILSTAKRRCTTAGYSLLETTSNALNPTMIVLINKN